MNDLSKTIYSILHNCEGNLGLVFEQATEFKAILEPAKAVYIEAALATNENLAQVIVSGFISRVLFFSLPCCLGLAKIVRDEAASDLRNQLNEDREALNKIELVAA